MTNSLVSQIVEKLEHLPDPTLNEVLDFVEFLTWRKTGRQVGLTNEEPLLSVAGVLSGDPLSDREIEAELYGV
ncbi:DUF2281 domain-containing protein [Leptolyngbyaceae cyanobacterium UHCC 1019]